jgi:O-antigen ligase/Flp pilus assembly protein TadD
MNQGSLIAQIARWTVLAALFVIPFLPLFVANGMFFPFITGKGFAFRILVEIALAAYVVLALVDPKYRPRFSWIFVFYGAFILWMLIADLFGANPHKAIWSNFERMEGWITLIHVFGFFVVSGAVLSADKLWRKWWLTFAGASALLVAYCLLQLAGGIQIHQGGVRVDGTFGNASYLAAYLLFACAITVWQALESRGWLRYTLLALSAFQALIIFFSATRGAILGLVGAIFVGGVLWMIESGKEGRKGAAIVICAVAVLVGGFYLVRDTSFVQSEPTLQRISSISLADLKVRTQLWGMALQGVGDRPILGWGQEGFNYIFNEYYQPSLYAQEPWFDRAHNAFIDWLVAGGIPGFLLFLITFGMAIFALYRGGASREERVLLIAALAAYAIQAMVVFDHLFTYVPLAAILATAHSVSSRPYKKLEEMPAVSETNAQMVAPIMAVLAIVVIWFVNVPNIAAAGQLVHAISITTTDITPNVVLFQKALAEPTYAHQEIREQLVMFSSNIASQQQGPSDALNTLTSFALGEMGKEVALQPNDARLRLQYALGFRIAGDYENALKQIGIAHELSPRKQGILLEQGIEYWQIGDFEKGRDSFVAAYELDTSFDALLGYAAAGDIAAGDLAGGKKRLMDKIGTTTLDSEPLILAYYQAKDYTDLILVLEEQVRNQNGSAQSYFRLAAALTSAGRHADARAMVAKAVAQHPETASQAAELLKHIPGG